MEPGDDIIDVLYRCRDATPSRNQHQNQYLGSSFPERQTGALCSPGTSLGAPQSAHRRSSKASVRDYSCRSTPSTYFNPPTNQGALRGGDTTAVHTPLSRTKGTWELSSDTPDRGGNRGGRPIPIPGAHHPAKYPWVGTGGGQSGAGGHFGIESNPTSGLPLSWHRLSPWNVSGSEGRAYLNEGRPESRLDWSPSINRPGDIYSGVGRVGYNNTPLPDRRTHNTPDLHNPTLDPARWVQENRSAFPGPDRRKEHFTRGNSQPDFFTARSSPIPRSISTFDSRSFPKYRRDYDPYSLSEVPQERDQDGGKVENEPVYVPRSVMADIIYKHDKEDDLIPNKHRNEDLIELASGARQRRVIEQNHLPNNHINKGMTHRNGGHPMRGEAMEAVSGLRHRKGRASEKITEDKVVSGVSGAQVTEPSFFKTLMGPLNTTVGYLVMLVIAYYCAWYFYILHENEMWFSEIQEVEREISFRTEQGLYYSYFKQLVSADSIWDGLKDLQQDNITETTKTINIIQRFNIHQEIFLAFAYQLVTFGLKPIFFYTYFIFALQGIYISALYLISWNLSGSWLSGCLTTLYAVINRFDLTRVYFSAPLRESFSLPFIFMQFNTVGDYFRTGNTYLLYRMFVFTLLYSITWQFAQFVSLIQCFAVFSMATVGLLDRDRACKVMSITALSIISVWYLQYYQPMVISSLVISFIPVAILSLQSQNEEGLGPGILKNIGGVIGRVSLALCVTIGLNTVLKLLLRQTADNHIFKFLKNKMWPDTSDFETRLYLCFEAFMWLDFDTYRRLTLSSALPLFGLYSFLCLVAVLKILYRRWRVVDHPKSGFEDSNGFIPGNNLPPGEGDSLQQLHSLVDNSILPQVDNRSDLCFHVGQSLLFGLLAMTTMRMKIFWTPYICIMATQVFVDNDIWSYITTKITRQKSGRWSFSVRHLLLVLVILYLGAKQKPVIEDELDELREFYDPDTVDLMQWIEQNTDKYDAFSGSMQLLAGVKLCTGRPITNHPHFEDKDLRDRTRELYQMYAKVSPKEVYNILTRYNASYVILEDSICLAHRARCTVPDIMDLVNGHIPEDGIRSPPHLVESRYNRFCEEVNYDSPEYRRYFSKVFENQTFRIFRLRRTNKDTS